MAERVRRHGWPANPPSRCSPWGNGWGRLTQRMAAAMSLHDMDEDIQRLQRRQLAWDLATANLHQQISIDAYYQDLAASVVPVHHEWSFSQRLLRLYLFITSSATLPQRLMEIFRYFYTNSCIQSATHRDTSIILYSRDTSFREELKFLYSFGCDTCEMKSSFQRRSRFPHRGL